MRFDENNMDMFQGRQLAQAPKVSTTGFKGKSEENIQLDDFWQWAAQYDEKPEIDIL